MTFEQRPEGGKEKGSEKHLARGPSQRKGTEVESGLLWVRWLQQTEGGMGTGARPGRLCILVFQLRIPDFFCPSDTGATTRTEEM